MIIWLRWPHQSSDLNPARHLWDAVELGGGERAADESVEITRCRLERFSKDCSEHLVEAMPTGTEAASSRWPFAPLVVSLIKRSMRVHLERSSQPRSNSARSILGSVSGIILDQSISHCSWLFCAACVNIVLGVIFPQIFCIVIVTKMTLKGRRLKSFSLNN